MRIIYSDQDGGSGNVPNVTDLEGKRYPGRPQCGVNSPGGIYVCTRPQHAKYTLHVGGLGSGVVAVWADESMGEAA